MDYENIHDYAVKMASTEYGSDVMAKINNKFVSSTTGRLTYVIKIIQALTDFFEYQNIAAERDQLQYVKEFHDYIKESLEGNDIDRYGILESLKKYFWIQEFKRDPEKQKAIALYLKFYVQYIKDNVRTIDVERFLEMLEKVELKGRYFDKNYVFGEMLKIIEAKIII
jgi:hypothetical protein